MANFEHRSLTPVDVFKIASIQGKKTVPNAQTLQQIICRALNSCVLEPYYSVHEEMCKH